MQPIVFTQGRASSCTFYHASKGIRTDIHGDDFVVVGMSAQLKWMQDRLEDKYDLTGEVLGPAKDQVKEARVLNRTIRWIKEGIEYAVDPRHVEIIFKQMSGYSRGENGCGNFQIGFSFIPFLYLAIL